MKTGFVCRLVKQVENKFDEWDFSSNEKHTHMSILDLELKLQSIRLFCLVHHICMHQRWSYYYVSWVYNTVIIKMNSLKRSLYMCV